MADKYYYSCTEPLYLGIPVSPDTIRRIHALIPVSSLKTSIIFKENPNDKGEEPTIQFVPPNKFALLKFLHEKGNMMLNEAKELIEQADTKNVDIIIYVHKER